MSDKYKVRKNDSEDLGFVLGSFIIGIINSDDISAWANEVLEEIDDPPLYIYDLLDYNDYKFHIYDILGFVPSFEGSCNEDLALDGIAYMLGRYFEDEKEGPAFNPAAAIKAARSEQRIIRLLKKNFPEIAERLSLS